MLILNLKINEFAYFTTYPDCSYGGSPSKSGFDTV